jgi:disulfide bond formation protein DsbB
MLLAASSLFLIYIATARTFLLGSAVFLLVYYYNTKKNIKKILWVFMLPLLFGISIYIKEVDINSVSSNRLFIWKEALSNGMNVWKLIFGNFDDVDYVKKMELASGDVVVQTMQRYAVDNVYIEVFINSGLIGFFLFLLGLKNILSKKMIKQLGNSGEVKKLTRVFYIAYAILISLLVSGLFYGHFPSFGNSLNSVLFPAVISIIFVFRNYILKLEK